MSFLLGCSTSNKKPHFEEVGSDYISKNFKRKQIDTIVKTKDYEFYFATGAVDALFFLKKDNKLFMLEPAIEIWNGFKEIQVINDSTLIFYTQFWNRTFGDYWIIKKGDNIDLKLDPGLISNTTVNDLVYKNGRLKEIGDLHVNVDSLELKKLRNKLYELKGDSLVEVDDFGDIKTDIPKFKDGVYYFSYPGRHISDTLYLNK